MLHNYLKIAFRTFWKNKVFTGITLGGLSVGITCFILLFLYVRYEFSFDQFHARKQQLYRLVLLEHQPEGAAHAIHYNTQFEPAFLETVRAENPSILRASRFQSTFWNWLKYDTKMKQDAIAYVDPEFLEMFSFPLIAGDVKTALNEPDGIVLNETLARFFFGDQHGDYSGVLGKTINLPASLQQDFTVRGVMQDLPEHSIFRVSAFTPYETWRGMGSSNNSFGRCHLYLELDSRESVLGIESSIGATFLTYYAPVIHNRQQSGRMSKEKNCLTCLLQPLSDVYLNADIRSDYIRNGNILILYILAGLASLILAIACINAVTIQLGQAVVRSREVGIRKVVGANRLQLVQQFFTEAGILCLGALLLAILLTELLLPSFNHLAEKPLTLSIFESVQTCLFLVLALLVTTAIIGGFPSLIMSRFSPLLVMRFQKPTQGRGLFTSGLVVVQFAITIILFFCTFVMQKQIHYVQEKDVGYQREGVMTLTMPRELGEQRKFQIKDRIRGLPFVIQVGGSDRNFASGRSDGYVTNQYNESVVVRSLRIDEDFLDTMQIKLVDGVNLGLEMTDSKEYKVLVNETMVREFGWKQPVGEEFDFWGLKLEVAGVVSDFHIDSMRQEMGSLLLTRGSWINAVNYLFIRYQEGTVEPCREAVERIWKEFEPDRSIELKFLDEVLHEQYQDELRINSITTWASCIAVMLSCMGLWGITAMAVARRTKEIGIRKVLGASESQLWLLFSHDLTRLFCFSLFVAVPLAWYAMQQWLNQFAYRIDIPWWLFFQAGLFCMLIALATVCWLVVRATLTNPVENLRYE